jgi:hypothetical protein
MARSRSLKRPRSPSHILDSKGHIDDLAFRARLSIKIVGGVLALIFTWLQFKEYELVPFVASTQPVFLRKLTLAIYYFCWVFGTSFDVSTQQAVYVTDPKKGRMSWDTIGAVLTLLLVVGILLWASENEKRFAAVLTVFVLTNILLWLYLLQRVQPIIRASENFYRKEKDFFELERLHVVRDYISGDWQWHRFVVMGAIVVVADLVCFVDPVRQTLSAITQLSLPDLSTDVASSLLPDFSLVVFVLVAESWIWTIRVRTRTSLNVMSALKGKYRIAPRGGDT